MSNKVEWWLSHRGSWIYFLPDVTADWNLRIIHKLHARPGFKNGFRLDVSVLNWVLLVMIWMGERIFAETMSSRTCLEKRNYAIWSVLIKRRRPSAKSLKYLRVLWSGALCRILCTFSSRRQFLFSVTKLLLRFPSDLLKTTFSLRDIWIEIKHFLIANSPVISLPA